MSVKRELIKSPEPCPPASIMIDGDVMATIDLTPLLDAINNLELSDPWIVKPDHAQGCYTVNGVPDSTVFVLINVETGDIKYFNCDGVIDAAVIGELDSCDPACCITCGEVTTDDCCGNCNPTDFPILAQQIGTLL